jgi:hypothetical protein
MGANLSCQLGGVEKWLLTFNKISKVLQNLGIKCQATKNAFVITFG